MFNAFLRSVSTTQGVGSEHLHVHVVGEGIDDLVGEIVVLFLMRKRTRVSGKETKARRN